MTSKQDLVSEIIRLEKESRSIAQRSAGINSEILDFICDMLEKAGATVDKESSRTMILQTDFIVKTNVSAEYLPATPIHVILKEDGRFEFRLSTHGNWIGQDIGESAEDTCKRFLTTINAWNTMVKEVNDGEF